MNLFALKETIPLNQFSFDLKTNIVVLKIRFITSELLHSCQTCTSSEKAKNMLFSNI